ncbi:MAG TPA: protein kinase, partial [Polyangiaceae bacterium]|nr:protein kinase [Polyangiaceae bacterium]
NKIFAEVALAIGNAHKMGVIHRDLKPGNIFLAREGELEITKVLDFGIAKVMSRSLSQTSGLGTRTGTLLGTPHYMSPEQARGCRDVDHTTDLWSLAIIAYECLTGQQPFSGASLGDIVVQICTEEPRLPSAVADVPAGFDDWFLRGASKKPSDRFASAREMADALSAVLLGREAASAKRTLVLAGTGTQHSVPIPLTRREPAGSSADRSSVLSSSVVSSSVVSSSAVTSSAVVASAEGVPAALPPSPPPASIALSAGSREPAAPPVAPASSLAGTTLLVARVRAGLAQLRSASPVRALLQGGAVLAEWWRGSAWWSAPLRWLTALRDTPFSAGGGAPRSLAERWSSGERWVLMVSLLCGAAVLSFWYSTSQRGASVPGGEGAALAAPLGESAPRHAQTPSPAAPPGLPEISEWRGSPEPERSARELVAGSEAVEHRPAPAAPRQRRREESSTAALRPGAAKPRPISEAAPARPSPPSAPPSSHRSSKSNAADPFADRL